MKVLESPQIQRQVKEVVTILKTNSNQFNANWDLVRPNGNRADGLQ